MEIDEKEYYELKNQLKELQSTVDTMNKPKQIHSIKELIKEQVISCVRNIENDKPIFVYSKLCNDEVWTAMLQIAKYIHRPDNIFYMSNAFRGSRIPYIRSTYRGNAPRRVSELTEEQILLSIQMLDEIIPIYNKYFKKIHNQVLYDPTGTGNYEWVKVLDEESISGGR